MEPSNVVSAHLDPNVAAILRKIAADEDRSVSWLVGLAVKQFISSRVAAPAVAGRAVQVDLEDAIAASKKSPSKSAKHK